MCMYMWYTKQWLDAKTNEAKQFILATWKLKAAAFRVYSKNATK